MSIDKSKLIKTLTKASEIEKNMPIAMAKSFGEVDEKMQGMHDKQDMMMGEMGSMKEMMKPEDKIDVQKVEIQGAELLTIKGEKGDKGDKGETGEKGEQGIQGIQGEKGKDGKDGLNGIDGINGKDGKDGKDGLDGKPADEKKIIEKIRKVSEAISAEIKKVDEKHAKIVSNYGAVASIKEIIAGNNIEVDNTNLGYPVISLTPQITVSAIEPTSPAVNDLWVDLS